MKEVSDSFRAAADIEAETPITGGAAGLAVVPDPTDVPEEDETMPDGREIRVYFRGQMSDLDFATEFMEKLLAATQPGDFVMVDFGE